MQFPYCFPIFLNWTRVGNHVIMQMATDILSACHLKFYSYESNFSATHNSALMKEREKEKKFSVT